jgi:hypothetical protein
MDERPPSSADEPAEGAPGRVKRDSQGNVVWEWAASAGRQALDSTSRLLRRLDVPGLRLLDEGESKDEAAPGAPPRRPSGKPLPPAERARQGFDPYEGQAGRASAPKPAAAAAPKPVRAGAAKPSLLSRLFGRR